MPRMLWHFPLFGNGIRAESPKWPEDWPLPRIGEVVHARLPGDKNSLLAYTVSHVGWYPEGELDGDEFSEPYIYIVTR